MSNPIAPLVVSACLGALVGLIRQWSEQKEKHAEAGFSGVRTFTLWALLGCIAAYLSQHYSAAILPVAMVLVGAQLMLLLRRDSNAPHQPGSTTFAAALLTCLVGALVNWGHQQLAVLTAAITIVTLGSKQPLHAWTQKFTSEDIRCALQFIAVTGVILPLVPNEAMGPYDAFNPYSTWMMVVLISGLGFGGYIMMRFLGAEAGIILTGLVGGLASSTATTLAFSRRSKDEPELSRNYALSVILACTVMLPRIAVIIAALNPALMRGILLPFAAMALPGAVYSVWTAFSLRHERTAVAPPRLSNPLGLGIAIKFGLIYAIVAFLVKAATALKLTASLLPLSFVSGLTDLDAIALLMANNLNDNTVILHLATQCVVAGAIANSLTKAVFAMSFGSALLRRHVAIVLGLTMAMGVIAMLFLIA